MTLDPFLTSILKNFRKSYGYEELSDPDAFERLVAFCCVSSQHPHAFAIDDVCPGGGHDLGLDTLAIVASGHVITSIEQWQDITKILRRVDVTFVLAQAKMASHFDSAAIGTFFEGATAFFQQKPSLPENDDIKDFRRIKDKIYADTHMLMDRPSLYLNYACAGSWQKDPHVVARVEIAKTRLEQSQLFKRVEFVPLDSEALRALYAELSQPTTVTIDFPNHATMPELARVRQAYIGVISCSEYLKLIQDESGRIRRTVFSDNVRDFQGNNPVNNEIHGTVTSPSEQQWLPLLNNGVTVVARQIQQVGTKFNLQGFQVVNGCQTSYVLWTNSDALRPGVMMPIKLIETTDLEFTAKVIQATNRQTEVKIEAFESLRRFHRDLEEYYNAMSDKSPVPLRYERRSGQYDWSDIEQRHVVSLASQIRAYLGVFLEEPHSTHRYYGELLDVNKSRIFLDNAKNYGSYYTAALAMFCVDVLLRKDAVGLRVFRPHIALLIRKSLGEIPSSAKERARYEEDFLDIIADKSRFISLFETATKRIETECRRRGGSLHELARRREFTKSLLGTAHNKRR